MSNHVCKEDQIKLIMECRKSGLSDFQWCEKSGIHPGNFYNWVSKLGKSGYTFPKSEAKTNARQNVQEVVKLDILPKSQPSSGFLMDQHVSFHASDIAATPAAELLIGNITLRFFNGTDERLIQSTLKRIGGFNNAW